MSNKDYYKILGVSRTATEKEIKKAYRRLAKKYHPDVSKENNAEARFKEANEAYDVLGDKEKRAEYDSFGSAWNQQRQSSQGWRRQQQSGNPFGGGFGGFGGFGGGGGNSSIFEDLFGGQSGGGFSSKKPQNQNASISVNLEDVFHGASKSIRLPNGGNIQVKIPAGIEDGKKIRLSGKGSNGGDLLLKIQINPHKQFKLKGKDITVEVPVSPWEAALGTTLTAPTLGGSVKLKIPAGTQSGKKMRLKGRGLAGKPAGNQYIVIRIHTPPANSDKEIQAYKEMEKTFSSWNPREGK